MSRRPAGGTSGRGQSRASSRTIVADGSTGAVISLHVTPRSSRNQIGPIEDGALRVRVTAPAVEGAANVALIRLLAETANVPRSSIEILAGATGRHKRVLVRGLTAGQVLKRLNVVE
jgi:uncharacterized protein (TIGR00251 family)